MEVSALLLGGVEDSSDGLADADCKSDCRTRAAIESTRLPGAGNGDVEAAVVPATEVATVSDGGAAEPTEVVELEVVVEAVWEEAIFDRTLNNVDAMLALLERGRGNGEN